MNKYRLTMVILASVSIFGMGCQAISSGIIKKSSTCQKVINSCTGKSTECDDEVGGDENSNTTSSENDILHSLPFSTMAQ